MSTSLSDDSSDSPFAIQPAVRDPYLFLFFRWKIIQHKFVYPPAVFFMLGNELCERFSFYGMRAILTLYLKFEHHFSNSTATLIYHLFSCIAYFTPLIGSLLADCWLGRFKVILFGSIIYVFGHALLSGGAIPFLSTGIRSMFDFSGLLVIALATGAIKPCVSAFAADQFREDQADLRAQFFSFFYFAINTGSLFAIFLTPILRGRVHCMGSKYCFPLAFGVPGVLMLVALLIFLAAVKLYKKPPPSKDNIGRQVSGCIYTGASRSICGKNKKPVDHWLDRAAPEHSSQLIEECKRFLAVVLIFSPLPFFWALYDQQGSTWILQAQRLNGRLGFFTMLPDQVNALNPLLILIFVPIFEGLIYPAARKVVKVTPLRKISVGLLLAALSFAMAGILQLEVNKTMEPSPAEGRVFIQKVGNAPASGFSSDTFGQINGGALSNEKTELDAGMYSADINGNKVPINLTDPNVGYVVGFFENANGSGDVKQFKYRNEKTENGATRIHVLVPEEDGGRIFACDNDGELDHHNSDAVADLKTGNYIDILPGMFSNPNFKLYWGNNCTGSECPNHIDIQSQMGAIFSLYVHNKTTTDDLIMLVRPNTVSIAWMFPQLIVITAAEILFSITGLEFAYSQSGPEMKSILQATWLMTVFFGNVIDILISGTHIIPEPALEFFTYAFLMLVITGVFIFLAWRYVYVEDRHRTDDLTPDMSEKDSSSKLSPLNQPLSLSDYEKGQTSPSGTAETNTLSNRSSGRPKNHNIDA